VARPAPDLRDEDDIIYPNTIPFVLVHLACVAVVWSGITWPAVGLGVLLYVVRMFGVTAGYHRYFSHRSYRTSRWFRLVLAWVAQSTSQKSVLWWAAIHRRHHKHSDTEADVHSPRHQGLLYSHLGWIFDRKNHRTAVEPVPDFARYPELRFLHRAEQLPALVLAGACLVVAGWPGLVVGFFWSTVLLYHGTFFINSLAHVQGSQRYVTADDSRNNWWLSLVTMGEGWHNNHHAYPRSARQGFRWYEFDATFYILKALSWAGVVWDLGTPPADLVRNERPLPRSTIERLARQLAASVARDPVQMRSPELTLDALRDRARRMIPPTPSLDDICARARALIA